MKMKKVNPIRSRSDKSRMLFSDIIPAPLLGRIRPIGWGGGLSVWGMLAFVIMAAIMPANSRAQDQEQIRAPFLDSSHAKRAYGLVETWLALEAAESAQADPIPVTGMFGVRLTLRSKGIVVGQGVAYRQNLSAVLDKPGEPIDLVTLLTQATEQAKAGVLDSLADARLRAVLEGRSIPEPVELKVADVHLSMVADLELAYGLQAIKLQTNADTQAIFTHFAPGYHGLGFTDQTTDTWSWVWPGEAVARNIAPSTHLTLGLKRLGLDRSRVQQLARPDGIGLTRFKSLHIVRPDRGLEPVMMVRSGTDLPRYTIQQRELVPMSDRLIEHLNSRFLDDHRIRGTYHPTSGRYNPPVATPEQAALASYAILHHCAYLAETRPDDRSRQIFVDKAMNAIEAIAWYVLSPNAEADPQVSALVLLAMLEAPADKADARLRDRVSELLLSHVEPQDQNAEPAPGTMKDGTAALVAAALATLYDRTRQPEAGQAARTLVDHLWDRPDKAPNLSALPWLVLAHERAGELLYTDEPESGQADELARRRVILGKVIDRLCQFQVIEKPGLGPDDVLGGFVLAPGPVGSPPNPDWRNAQALMLLASSLRDDVLTDQHDKLGWMIAAGYSARFVDQLMMDDNSCYYVRDRIAVRGGVRMAPWDNRLAVAPSAMSLLALTELQATLTSFRPAPLAPTNNDPGE